jgi:hypothetical protein
LRIIFSVTSTSSAALAASNEASDSPPAFPRSLWHVTQYCFTTALWSSTLGVAACGRDVTGARGADEAAAEDAAGSDGA